jgi:hypothetical protein
LSAATGTISNFNFLNATGTFFSAATGTFGAVTTSNLWVTGQLVCLANGVNCPGGVFDTLQSVTSRGSFTTTTLQFFGGFVAASSSVTGTLGVTGSFYVTGTSVVTGSSSFNGVDFRRATGTNVTTTNLFATNFFGGNATTTYLTIGTGVIGDILPVVNGTQSIGSLSLRWDANFDAVYASSVTTTYFSFEQATGTRLSFTNVTGTNVSSTNIYAENANFYNGTSVNFMVSSTLSGRFANFNDFQNIRVVGSLDYAGALASDANTVDVVNQYAYVSDNSFGIIQIDISNPEYPTLVNRTVLPSGGGIQTQIHGNYLITGTNAGSPNSILIHQMADGGASSTLLGRTGNSLGGANTALFAYGRYLYSGMLTGSATFDVYDIQDPYLPRRVNSVSGLPGTPRTMHALGELLYVGHDTGIMSIYNIANPSSPVFLSTVSTTRAAYGIYATGKHAYVVADTGPGGGYQLLTYDVSTATTPVLMSQISVSGNGGISQRALQVLNNYAFIGTGDSGLNIVDVSSSTNPVLVKRLTGFSGSVKVVGRYAYIADDNNR